MEIFKNSKRNYNRADVEVYMLTQISWHANFECKYFNSNGIKPARTDAEYLFVTVLRGLLLSQVDPPRWKELQKFESHSDKRQRISHSQLKFLIAWLEGVCGPKVFKVSDIEFVYGVLLVNGYSHASK